MKFDIKQVGKTKLSDKQLASQPDKRINNQPDKKKYSFKRKREKEKIFYK